MSTEAERGLIVAADEERAALDMLERLLVLDADRDGRFMIERHDERVALPDSLLLVLRRAVHAFARDRAVSVAPIRDPLRAEQAADILNVSPSYLIEQLDEGTIPHVRVGTERRVRLDDLLAYRRHRDAEVRAGLDRLTQMSQEFGLYSDRESTLADSERSAHGG